MRPLEWRLDCGHTTTGRFMELIDDKGNKKTMCMKCYEEHKKSGE